MKKNWLINKNFALLFWGRLVSDIGNAFYQFAIGWYILSLTQSAEQAGLYMAFGGIVFLVMTPLSGVIVDRLDRIKVIYITDWIRGITILITGYFIISQPNITLGTSTLDFANTDVQMVLLYITAFIFSVNGALFNPAVTTSIPYLVDDASLQRANSLHAGMHAFVSIIGALFAGILYGLLGVGFVFIINGVAYILSAISEMFIQAKTKIEVTKKFTIRVAFAEFNEGIQFILQKQGMLVFVFVVLVVNFFASPLFAIAQPYFYNQVVQVEPFLYSFIGLGFSLGSIATAIYLSQKPTSDKVHPFLRKGLLGFTLGVFLLGTLVTLYLENILPFVWLYGLSIVVSLGIGVVITYVNTPIGVAIHRYVPKEKMGRVNAIISFMAQGVVPISTALSGWMIDQGSLPLFYLIVVLGMALGSWMSYRSKSLEAF